MSKLGNIVARFESSSFSSALKDVKENFTGYLSDEELESLENLDSIRTDAVSAYNEAIASLVEEGSLKGFFGKTGRSYRITTRSVADKRNGKLEIMPAASLDKLTIFWDDNMDLVKEALAYRGINSFLADKNKEMTVCLFTTKAGLDIIENIHDTIGSFKLSDIIEEVRISKKEARKNKVVHFRNENVFKTSDGCKTYDALKEWLDTNNKTGIIEIRSNFNDRSSMYATFKVPTSKEEEKEFRVGDIYYKSVYDSPREVASALGIKDLEFIKIKAGDYKRLKLWNDEELVLEQDFIKNLLNDRISKIEARTIKSYTDHLLQGDSDDIQTALDKFEEFAPEGGTSTRFYKLYKKALEKILEKEEFLARPENDIVVNHSRWLDDFGIENPIKRTVITNLLFKDYPLLRHYGNSYLGDFRVTYNTDFIKEVWDYVMLVESSLSK